MLDFGDRATGKIVDPTSLDPLPGTRIVTGTVMTLFPQDPRYVGIMTDDGEPYTIRTRAA